MTVRPIAHRRDQALSDRHIPKKIADTLAIVCPSDRLSNCAADVDDLDLGTPLLLVAERHCVGDHDLRQAALVDRVDGTALSQLVYLEHNMQSFALLMYDFHGRTYTQNSVSLCQS